MCHQSVSLIARYLEAHDIATVVMGCARDIVEFANPPRFFWSDFPLGHSAGKPHDPASQDATLRGALALFDSAGPGDSTAVSPQRWASSDSWKQDFMDVSHLSADDIAKLRAAHERVREAKAGGASS